ncbi:hypothetical protein SK128_005003, partial [Halocaridina rubra]
FGQEASIIEPGKELQNSEEDIEPISTTPNNTATITDQDNQITPSSTNNQPSNRLQNNEENIPSKSSPHSLSYPIMQ